MYKKLCSFLTFSFSFFLIFNSLFAQTKKKSKIFELTNGMKVILKENHSNPMIASIIYVNAGSKYETDFNNGVTHLLEHLLFDGTKKRSPEQITEEVKSKGGYVNAFTRKELTCYMILLPKESVEFGLDLQSDMLFNSIFPDSELAKERKVVIEEIKKDKDDIDNLVEEFFDSQVYKNTPYARPVIGYESIIENISKEDIINYHRAYYEPNNMTALVIGDFDQEEIIKLLEKYFDSVPPRKLPTFPEIKDLSIQKTQIKYIEKPTKNTYVNLSFNAPHFSDENFYSFDVLASYLNSGETSPLYKALLKGENPLGTELSVNLEMQKEFSRMNISIVTDSPDKVEKILKSTEKVLTDLSKEKLTQEDIKRILVSKKTSDYYLEERLHFYGMLKSSVIVNAGIDFLESYLDRLQKTNPKKVQKIAKKYFSHPPYIASVVTPQKEEKKEEKTESKTLYKKEILPNGLTVIIKSNPDSKVLGINILGENRSASEPEGKTGIADLTNRLLLKGTKKRSAEQITKDLGDIGAEITLVDNPYIPYDDIYTTPLFTFIKFQTIDEFADKGTELLSDIARNPIFSEQEIENSKSEMIGLIKREETSTYQNARRLFYSELFKGQPYEKSIMGDTGTIRSITAEDLKEFHRRFYAPDNMIITIATNLSPDEMLEKVRKYFGDMPKVDFAIPEIPSPKPLTAPIKAEKKMEKEQVYIYLGNTVPGINDPDAPALAVMNSILSSRLGLNLREKKGLAYSVGSTVSFDKNFGWFFASMGTQPKNYDEAVKGILNEINQMKKSLVSEEELEKAKNGIWGDMLMYRLSRINQAYWMGVNEFKGVGYDYDDKYLEKLRGVTKEEVKKVAEKYLDTKNYLLAVVGKI
jgi:zinc protease